MYKVKQTEAIIYILKQTEIELADSKTNVSYTMLLETMLCLMRQNEIVLSRNIQKLYCTS